MRSPHSIGEAPYSSRLTVSRKVVFSLLACLLTAATVQARSEVLAYAAGDVAECRGSAQRSAAAHTASMIPTGAVVFVMGDTTYPIADRGTIEACYAPTWGRFLAHTYAVPGNHDYVNGSLTDFLDYFGARTPGRPWFRAQVGDWWVIGLDSNIGSPELDEQQAWLAEQLKEIEGDGRCILAMWHHPVFSTGLHRKDGARMRPAWAALYGAGADLVLNGHEHFYESFEPRDAAGRPAPTGLREIIAGTGGARLIDFSLGRGYKAYTRTHGVLELHLEQERYEYAFRTVDGKIRDSGSAMCRRASTATSAGKEGSSSQAR